MKTKILAACLAALMMSGCSELRLRANGNNFTLLNDGMRPLAASTSGN